MHFSENTCVASIDGNYYVSSCKKGFCSPVFGSSNSTCNLPSDERLLINFPGTSCSSSSDCFSNYCYKKVCKGKEKGEKCSSSYDCDGGLFCSSSFLCEPLLPAGSSGCLSDFSCSPSSGCNSSKCIPYFSLLPGSSVDSCPASHKNLLCSSGICGKKDSKTICLEKVKNKLNPPFKCEKGSTCKSTPENLSGLQLETECLCGLSKNGEAFCGLFPGDPEMLKLIEKLKEWSQGSLAEKCNTMVRFEESCMKTWWGEKYYEFIYEYWKAEYYPWLVDAEDCVLEVYMPEYYEAYIRVEGGSSSSSSFSVILSVTLWMISC
jgi:hypothetical protein